MSATPTVTELRIHGVGGASPEELLGVPHTRLVAGGEDAGFFRPASWMPSMTSADDLEAYSWGGITSRARSRALWLFLLPFALMNVGGWMSEPPTGSARRSRLAVAAIRLEALLATAIFTTLIAILTIDIVGGRCTGSCLDAWYLGPWRWWASDRLEGVAVGAGVAALVMVGIALIAGVGRPQRSDETSAGDPAHQVGLFDGQLWGRPDVVGRLGYIHFAVAFSLIALHALEAADTLATGSPQTAPRWFALAVAVVAVGLLGAVGSAAGWPFRAVAVAAGAATVWAIAGIARLSGSTRSPEGPLLVATARLVFVVFLLLFVVRWAWYVWRFVVVAGVRRARRGRTDLATVPEPPPTKMLPSTGPGGRLVSRLRRWAAAQWDQEAPPLLSLRAAVPVLGAGIAAAIGAGVLLRVQRLLGTDYPTEVVEAVAVYGLGWVILVVLVATWVWFSHPGRTPAEIAADFPDARLDLDLDDAWLRQVSSAESAARITDRVETVITLPAVVMAALLVGVPAGTLDPLVERMAPFAAWVLSLLPIGLIFAMNSLYRSRQFRRSLGIIWDVATFWPRWFHPWAPPSYGERAVPHLTRRLSALTGEGSSVIVSAHSQGTVVAAAAIALLPEECRRHIAVVTHGSPLARLYARYFPQMFAVEGLRRLAGQLAEVRPVRWRNLYRSTDYIGGAVFGAATDTYEDVRVPDPHDARPLMEGDPRPRTLNHSNYYADSVYRSTIEDLARELRAVRGRR